MTIWEIALELSESKSWGYACLEWELVGLNVGWTYCACGHSIKEACVVKNKLNGNVIIVGNCCLRDFPYEHDTLLALRALHECRITDTVIKLVCKYGLLTKRERKFMLDVWRKRKLSEKQRKWYRALKEKIFDAFEYNCP